MSGNEDNSLIGIAVSQSVTKSVLQLTLLPLLLESQAQQQQPIQQELLD